jgi:hypothetical protein
MAWKTSCRPRRSVRSETDTNRITIGVTLRRTARKIRRLKGVVGGMCPGYSDSADPRLPDALLSNLVLVAVLSKAPIKSRGPKQNSTQRSSKSSQAKGSWSCRCSSKTANRAAKCHASFPMRLPWSSLFQITFLGTMWDEVPEFVQEITWARSPSISIPQIRFSNRPADPAFM